MEPNFGKQSVNVILTVLEIVAPVLLLACIGFSWVKLGYEYRLEFVTRLAMTLSVPALIFTALINTDLDPSALTGLFLATLLTYLIISALALITVKLAGMDSRTYVNPLTFGNTGNLGMPLALFAFGDVGLSYAIVVFAVMAFWSFTFGLYVTSGGGSPFKALKEPLVWATVLGALFLWQGWKLPKFAMNTLELLGQIAIPIMLITLGVAVARLRPTGLFKASAISIAKVTICAGIAFGMALIFNLSPEPTAVLIVQMATPVAVTSYMLAEKYGADSDAVAALVVASTLLSIIYLPVLLSLVI